MSTPTDNYQIKRGYVKWTDENGVFHKEPLYDHQDLLAKATPAQQIAAEEARRLNESAEKSVEDSKTDSEQDSKDTLEALKKAPDDVLTVTDLIADAPASGAEDSRENEPNTRAIEELAVETPTADKLQKSDEETPQG